MSKMVLPPSSRFYINCLMIILKSLVVVVVVLMSHDLPVAFSFVVDNSISRSTCGGQRSNCAMLLHRTKPSASSGATRIIMQQSSSSGSNSATTKSSAVAGVSIPSTWDEMVRQVASAIKMASANGKTRQIVRVFLPRDATSGDFGKYLELAKLDSDNLLDDTQISLVPPDESWQGGIMQLYRAAAPTGERIVRQIMTTRGGLPPRIVEDRSVDESGVDGVGLLQTSDGGKVSCWIQPCQESVNQIVTQSAQKAAQKAKTTDTEDNNIDKDNDDNLIILLNPQWRLVDDAIDEASKKSGFLGGLANMLGGKGGALKQVSDAGFVPVYTLEGYVCRGANVRLLQVYKEEEEEVWSVFCERDDGESYIPVGSQKPKRPTYQQVETMMNEAGIGYKYARDMGMNPKL